VGSYEVGDSATDFNRVSGKEVAGRARQGPSYTSGYNANGITDGDQPFGALVHDKAADLRYPVVKKTLYSDTMFAKKTKSLRLHTCAQVFMDGVSFTHAYPMKRKSEAGDRLEKLLRTLQTIPEATVTDGAGEEIGGDWKRTIDKYRIQDKRTKPYSPWQNQAELEIREQKKAV
jgi:hypothetical protein